MADNVIPFPVRRKEPELAPGATDDAMDRDRPVTREEMIQLVLRYAYGTSWAQEPRTAPSRKDD